MGKESSGVGRGVHASKRSTAFTILLSWKTSSWSNLALDESFPMVLILSDLVRRFEIYQKRVAASCPRKTPNTRLKGCVFDDNTAGNHWLRKGLSISEPNKGCFLPGTGVEPKCIEYEVICAGDTRLERRRKTEFTHNRGGGLRESRMDRVQLDEQGPFEQKISVILGVTEWVKNGRGNYRGPQWPRMQSSSASRSRTENSRPAEGSSVKISLPALERIVPIPATALAVTQSGKEKHWQPVIDWRTKESLHRFRENKGSRNNQIDV
ncbi:hypothetical protein B0H14DRAFT_2607409 [Mycena olivaceomarginata]|nr:hypothetical protein B0H14DRAFT_2607409 [Mycena olivaceomarginata]